MRGPTHPGTWLSISPTLFTFVLSLLTVSYVPTNVTPGSVPSGFKKTQLLLFRKLYFRIAKREILGHLAWLLCVGCFLLSHSIDQCDCCLHKPAPLVLEPQFSWERLCLRLRGLGTGEEVIVSGHSSPEGKDWSFFLRQSEFKILL